MAVKKFKPVTPGTRFRIGNAYTELTTDTPEKSLLAPMKRSGGRNHSGKMTVRHVGGGHKKRYRVIDFKRNKHGVSAVVKTVEYDPNRSGFISLVVYKDGEKRYIIAPEGIKVGQQIIAGPTVEPEVGNALPLSKIPLGSVIHNVELTPGKGAAMCRSAGTYAQLVNKEEKYVVVKLPSGETRKVLATCYATIGSVSNADHALQSLGKAGRKRWLGKRPRTRGVAMNPVDHPMGGGEGKASGGHPRSRTGIFAKGQKTRRRNRQSDALIISRKKKTKSK